MAIGPAVSWTGDSGTIPVRLTRPAVGLTPTTPQALDGETIEPSVSVPTASGASPADTPAADPELDPDGLLSSTYGLLACPPRDDQPLLEWVDRKFAHSDRFAFARITAPAARSRETMKASGGHAGSSAGEPAVVGMPATWTLSFTSTGMPSSGPRGWPDSQASSLAAASAIASWLTVITACSAGFSSSIRSRKCRVSAVAVSRPSAIAWRSSATDDDTGSMLAPEVWAGNTRKIRHSRRINATGAAP